MAEAQKAFGIICFQGLQPRLGEGETTRKLLIYFWLAIFMARNRDTEELVRYGVRVRSHADSGAPSPNRYLPSPSWMHPHMPSMGSAVLRLHRSRRLYESDASLQSLYPHKHSAPFPEVRVYLWSLVIGLRTYAHLGYLDQCTNMRKRGDPTQYNHQGCHWTRTHIHIREAIS